MTRSVIPLAIQAMITRLSPALILSLSVLDKEDAEQSRCLGEVGETLDNGAIAGGGCLGVGG
ncbi:hypothetical protein FOCG_17350 [Fusarium oxysporum f. sp. radicis-lycopersici 26381]|nr:hypothetical protein FOWG_17395 [Fusarium oxysporum f. sp. lycopersici MN25]EXL40077.1 hypothetical protein FOCG_17350 [Fusarium oxysporum f. sp. radicis-lycopersici 26381]